MELQKCRKLRNVQEINLDALQIKKLIPVNSEIDLTRYDTVTSCKILYELSKKEYTFEKYKTTNNVPKKLLKVLYTCNQEKKIQDAIKQITYANISRDLSTEPSNKLYPSKYCKRVEKLFEEYPFVKVKIYNVADLEKMGMNLIVASGKGSTNNPYMCVIEMNPGKSNLCLVGKGVCFDAGGTDIKNSSYGMNVDKMGASFVVGIMKYLCDSSKYRKKSVIGILPLTENIVDGKAIKPGDIITAYNKLTVEIVNTDAEGRLLLADALSYTCEKYNPTYIFDFATLTGDASVRHFAHSYMTYTENRNLTTLLSDVCEHKTGERGIPISPWCEYMEYTKSLVADVKNLSHGYYCGEFMAAMFLRNFIPTKYIDNWVHFDLAHNENSTIGKCSGIHSCIELVKNILT